MPTTPTWRPTHIDPLLFTSFAFPFALYLATIDGNAATDERSQHHARTVDILWQPVASLVLSLQSTQQPGLPAVTMCSTTRTRRVRVTAFTLGGAGVG